MKHCTLYVQVLNSLSTPRNSSLKTDHCYNQQMLLVENNMKNDL